MDLDKSVSRRKFLQSATASIAVATTAHATNVLASAEKTLSENIGKPRIAIVGIFEEVNTFATESMGFAEITGDLGTGFQKFEGEEILKEFKGTSTQIGGYIDGLEEQKVDIVPGVYYQYSAGPTISDKAYNEMKAKILANLKDAGQIDGVLLGVHGAGITQSHDDMELDLITSIRQQLGAGIKIGAGIDHHSTLMPETVDNLDFLALVKHYPHTDFYGAGKHSALHLVKLIKGEVTAHGHFEQLPFIMQTVSTDPGNAYAPIRRKVEEFSQNKGIYEISLQYGFPWADIKSNTAAVNCWAETAELATKTAKELAQWIWKKRDSFVVETLSAQEALFIAADQLAAQGRISTEQVENAKSLSSDHLYDQSIANLTNSTKGTASSYGFVPDKDRKGPVVISEKSDNPGAGAPGDATYMLQELIKYGVQQACVSSIQDAETVQQAVKAGVGATIDVTLGGKLSKLSGESVKGKAYVKSISDGHFTIIGPMVTGFRLSVGTTVGLQIGGVDVVVVSGLMQSFDNGQMRICGFDPMDYRIVTLKSANHFRAYWVDVASSIIDSDSPGIASNDLKTVAYKESKRNIYPLDPSATYPG